MQNSQFSAYDTVCDENWFCLPKFKKQQTQAYQCPCFSPNVGENEPKKIFMNNFKHKKYSSDDFTTPPAPPQGRDDLWDLQFCRWWGWNWVRRREEDNKIGMEQKCGYPGIYTHQPHYVPLREIEQCRYKKKCKNLCHKFCSKKKTCNYHECPVYYPQVPINNMMYSKPMPRYMNKDIQCERGIEPYRNKKSKKQCYKESCKRVESWIKEKPSISLSEEETSLRCSDRNRSSLTQESIDYLSVRLHRVTSNENNSDAKCRNKNKSPKTKKCKHFVCHPCNKCATNKTDLMAQKPRSCNLDNNFLDFPFDKKFPKFAKPFKKYPWLDNYMEQKFQSPVTGKLYSLSFAQLNTLRFNKTKLPEPIDPCHGIKKFNSIDLFETRAKKENTFLDAIIDRVLNTDKSEPINSRFMNEYIYSSLDKRKSDNILRTMKDEEVSVNSNDIKSGQYVDINKLNTLNATIKRHLEKMDELVQQVSDTNSTTIVNHSSLNNKLLGVNGYNISSTPCKGNKFDIEPLRINSVEKQCKRTLSSTSVGTLAKKCKHNDDDKIMNLKLVHRINELLDNHESNQAEFKNLNQPRFQFSRNEFIQAGVSMFSENFNISTNVLPETYAQLKGDTILESMRIGVSDSDGNELETSSSEQ